LSEYILSVIIPCYNEKQHIEALVRKVLESPVEGKELIVVDDFSTDGTREVLEAVIRPLVSKIIYHEQNGGKGAALRTGFQAATGRICIVQDADLEYDPLEYPRVIQPIIDGDADVVLGSRFLGGSDFGGYSQNRMANKGLTVLSNLFTGLHLTDMETCYKAFKREIIQSIEIEENRFGFEPEIVAKIAKRKCSIKEVPISYHPRTIKEGKKIGFRDGMRALYCIAKYRGR
jgi:glycosyltransferase involved in cell wall biosynthesis